MRGLERALRGAAWEDGAVAGLRLPWPTRRLSREDEEEAEGTGQGAEESKRGGMRRESGPGRGPVFRCWWGATAEEHADAYGRYVALTGMMAFRRARGCKGAWTLRRVRDGRAEFLVLSLWDSMDAVRGFAGENPERAVFYPEDERYLTERDETVEHWQVVQGRAFEESPTESRGSAAALPA